MGSSFIHLIRTDSNEFFLAAMGLHWSTWAIRCHARAFSSCDERGLCFVPVHGPLLEVASLVLEHGL